MSLRETYESLFPPPIARRMIEQGIQQDLDRPCYCTARGHLLATFCDNWRNTKEGYLFWFDIAQHYWFNTTPTKERIKAVFSHHNIPYE